VYDPEGLFSSLPALANVLFGMLAAMLWQRDRQTALRWILLGGVALAVAGLLVAPWFPLNKRLWTSSFALLTAGLSALLLALCMVGGTRTAQSAPLAPLMILGRNAILAYVLSMLAGLVNGSTGQYALFEGLAGLVGNPYLASALYPLGVVLVIAALIAPLDRRGIHLRL
jgi:predicted acyltransferase